MGCASPTPSKILPPVPPLLLVLLLLPKSLKTRILQFLLILSLTSWLNLLYLRLSTSTVQTSPSTGVHHLLEGLKLESTSWIFVMLTSHCTTSWSSPSCPETSSPRNLRPARVTPSPREPAKTFKMSAFLLLLVYWKTILVLTCSLSALLSLTNPSICLFGDLLWEIILTKMKFFRHWNSDGILISPTLLIPWTHLKILLLLTLYLSILISSSRLSWLMVPCLVLSIRENSLLRSSTVLWGPWKRTPSGEPSRTAPSSLQELIVILIQIIIMGFIGNFLYLLLILLSLQSNVSEQSFLDDLSNVEVRFLAFL